MIKMIYCQWYRLERTQGKTLDLFTTEKMVYTTFSEYLNRHKVDVSKVWVRTLTVADWEKDLTGTAEL